MNCVYHERLDSGSDLASDDFILTLHVVNLAIQALEIYDSLRYRLT